LEWPTAQAAVAVACNVWRENVVTDRQTAETYLVLDATPLLTSIFGFVALNKSIASSRRFFWI
jgi:hypothetical protein